MLRNSILFAIALLMLISGCARLPGTGVTSLKPASVSELRGYLLNHKADLEQFRLRGPFAVGNAMPGLAAAPPEAGTLDLRDLWRLIVKHKWMLVSVATVGLVAALLLSFVRTPLYLATSSLQIDKRAPRVVKFGQEDMANQDMDERTVLGTHLELLKSRVLAERVIDELRLDRQGLPTHAKLRSDAAASRIADADLAEN